MAGFLGAVYRRVRARLAGDHRRTVEQFHAALIRHTRNFGDAQWLGVPIWQNVLDLWTVQEVITRIRPALLIETGTHRGGSSLYFAHLFDLLGRGDVVTIDTQRLHTLSHPRVRYLVGSSTSDGVLREVRRCVLDARGPVMVILDSDHSEPHVSRELECYAPFVTRGSYLLVQDGIIDTLPVFARDRPGPLGAIRAFVRDNAEFEIDDALCSRFLLSHHPKGWLRRK